MTTRNLMSEEECKRLANPEIYTAEMLETRADACFQIANCERFSDEMRQHADETATFCAEKAVAIRFPVPNKVLQIRRSS